MAWHYMQLSKDEQMAKTEVEAREAKDDLSRKHPERVEEYVEHLRA
jgi:hypothetical protein